MVPPPWKDSLATEGPLTHEDPKDHTDPMVLTLACAVNGFQNLGRYSLLWEMQHQWPGGARFAFKCTGTNAG